MAYIESAAEVACNSQIAVMVLLSRNNDDVELWPWRPRMAEMTSPAEFAARQLRSVGVIGLSGKDIRCAFKESLEPRVVDAIGAAFDEYVRVLLGRSLTDRLAAAEVAELERLFQLPDARPN